MKYVFFAIIGVAAFAVLAFAFFPSNTDHNQTVIVLDRASGSLILKSPDRTVLLAENLVIYNAKGERDFKALAQGTYGLTHAGPGLIGIEENDDVRVYTVAYFSDVNAKVPARAANIPVPDFKKLLDEVPSPLVDGKNPPPLKVN